MGGPHPGGQDRPASDPNSQIRAQAQPPAKPQRGARNRSALSARLLAAAAFVTSDPTLTAVAFIARLGAHAEAVADLRQAQQRAAQAVAARTAAERLRAAAGAPMQTPPYGPARVPTAAGLAQESFPAPPQPLIPEPPAQGHARLTGRVPARSAGPAGGRHVGLGGGRHVGLGGDRRAAVQDQARRRPMMDPASHYPEPLGGGVRARGAARRSPRS